jgi:inorganic triphosphatase YgiF
MEIEAKFRLIGQDTTSLQKIVSIIEKCGFDVDCMDEPIRIVDTYFDTDRFFLRRAGAAIRLRLKDENVLLTYKRKVAQEGALHSRIELEAEPNHDHLTAVIGELQDLALEGVSEVKLDLESERPEKVLAMWGLAPVVEILTIRDQCELREGQQPVAIFVLDQVSFVRGGRRGGYVGIEIEAIGEQNTAKVMKISEALKDNLGESIQEQDISKYEFALGSL